MCNGVCHFFDFVYLLTPQWVANRRFPNKKAKKRSMLVGYLNQKIPILLMD